MGTTGAFSSLPWFEIAIAGTQAVIALTLLCLTYRQHSTQLRIQRALKVHEWGNECIDAFADVERFCLLTPHIVDEQAYAKHKNELLRRLSALVDRGRMFFKNKQQEHFGQEKQQAYRGLRPAILDPLIAAYMAIEVLDKSSILPDLDRKERLCNWRREFVSVLQKEIHSEWLKKATKYTEELGGGAGNYIDADSQAPSVAR